MQLRDRAMLKVCGLTREGDVHLVRELGVSAAGFILAPSPRRVSRGRLRELVKVLRRPSGSGGSGSGRSVGPPSAAGVPLAIGVFGDASVDEIAEVAVEAELDGIQLHGATSLEEMRELRGRLEDVVLIKALGIEAEGAPPQGSGQAAEELAAQEAPRLAAKAVELAAKATELNGLVDLILLDTRVAGSSGGTGVTFPWSLASGLGPEPPCLVAGGIGPQNLCRALTESRAAGADVSSRVESAPGIKDHDMLRELVDAWRRCPRPRGGAVSAELVRGKGRA